ncbi:MAG: HAMP domain-containing histidine kinase [Deltaproteobacteria bacterium]|nr:HAMP domain-containing histidine kinase [Deltaproteobacteria bacterium]
MRSCEVDFIGKIIAAVSHEFMNVLATIRESSGLMEDLLSVLGTGFPYKDKLTKSFAITRKQVSRGMEIGANLNAFAHNMDAPRANQDINALVHQISYLMGRFARLKQIELEVQPAESPLQVETDPFRLQLVIAKCIESCMKRTANGGVITLKCRKGDREVRLECRGEPLTDQTGAAPLLDSETADLKEILQMLGAELSCFTTGNRGGFEISIPYSGLR